MAFLFIVSEKSVFPNPETLLISPFKDIWARDKSKKNELFHNSMRMIQGDNPTSWLTLDKAKLKGSFDHVPERADIPEIFNEQLVVELYSK